MTYFVAGAFRDKMLFDVALPALWILRETKGTLTYSR